MLVDPETGEILNDNYKLETKEDKERKRYYHNQSVEMEVFKQFQKEEMGSFVFFVIDNMDKLTNILNDSELVRYIYISTFTKSNGYLQVDNNLDYINKEKLEKLMNTNERTFSNFYNKLIENKLLIEEPATNYIMKDGEVVADGYDETRLKLQVDSQYAYKGKVPKHMKAYIRLYVNKIRELYLNTDGRSLRKLAIVYKLMKFISWKHNILCYNPEESNVDMLQPLKIEDILDYLGYKKGNLYRFKNDFYSLKSGNDYIFMTLQKGTSDYLKSTIVVNPKFMYAGNDLHEVQWLMNSFKVKSEQNYVN